MRAKAAGLITQGDAAKARGEPPWALYSAAADVERRMTEYRLSDALEEALRIIWDDDKREAFEAGGYDRLRAVLAEVDRG